MSDSPLTEIELMAQEAVGLPAFPINLRQIRDNICLLLSEVGRYGFFNEYTDHSFSHVLDMLKTAEWIIPNETAKIISPADSLFIVLSTYFHDVGLLISRDEFNHRHKNNDFQKFKTEPQIPASKFKEFQARLNQMSDDERERLSYQEFVRSTHGQRVRSWIEGVPLDDNNAAAAIRSVFKTLLDPLDDTVRRDLGLVCESHTKDDISDTKRFKVSQPYGPTEKETVNLQYVAAILRTVDLLQITKGRAPSVLFQVINPTDPVSQIEWQKQNAVRSVRKKAGVDREGKASSTALSDTIEVHARFKESDGFFGLTSYLTFAERELQATYASINKSAHLLATPPLFPWRYIDAGGVEADGFLTESFGFSLDQQKILDLLTGHTLYNDTTVVLRELTQNALDAVRLQAETEKSGLAEGLVNIQWDSSGRILTVSDNGTGMSQEVIVNHLLKVGSSRYQDPQFRDKYPNFSSISRFGIGVLSTFMVSDDVQITTCSSDDVRARKIALRSVHGKYLIKLLDKISDREEIKVFPHGTSVRLVLRPTADIGDVVEISRMWLMFPRCKVSVKVDELPNVEIGFKSPSDAISDYLASRFRNRDRLNSEIEVRELHEDGVTLAFAVRKDELFKDWSFLESDREIDRVGQDHDNPPCAICVEGVGVEFQTPGFSGQNIIAIANAVGSRAPKTNVARSALEDTPEQREMLSKIYRMYARHVTSEVERLAAESGFSLSRAVTEAPYIASSLLAPQNRPTQPALLSAAVGRIPLFLIEDASRRSNVAFESLLQNGQFWTVESPLSRSIETFLRETSSDITAGTLVKSLGNTTSIYPAGKTVCNSSSSQYLDSIIEDKFELREVIADTNLRRLDLLWIIKAMPAAWLHSEEIYWDIYQSDRRFADHLNQIRERINGRRLFSNLSIPLGKVSFTGLDEVCGFISNRGRYLKSESPITKYVVSLWHEASIESLKRVGCCLIFIEIVINYFNDWTGLSQELIERSIDNEALQIFRPYLDQADGLVDAIRRSNPRFFDPYAWDRRPGK